MNRFTSKPGRSGSPKQNRNRMFEGILSSAFARWRHYAPKSSAYKGKLIPPKDGTVVQLSGLKHLPFRVSTKSELPKAHPKYLKP